ncbi:MAG: ATP-grasp domain-containing protein, partial [Paludibacteraceae bacterium]|nr:ATP-grasp domain-containing protein [Paludibacteraceae bacterium]
MKKILILGAGAWQVPYIKKAKEMGLYVLATDWGENPDGRPYADEFASISVRDKEKSLEYAEQHHIDAVFTNSDVGVPTAAYIAEKMHLPCYTQEQAELATDKYVMRTKIKSVGLKTPQFYLCSDKEELLAAYDKIETKSILKPIDNCGSRGVCIIDSKETLERVCQEAFDNSFAGKVLLEELMIGHESSVEVLIDKGQEYIMGWCKKQKSPYPYRYDIRLDYYNPEHTAEENTAVEEMVHTLVHGIGMQDGIMHIEFIWTADGVKIIEFALRGCGSDVITHLMPELRGFDIMAYLLNKALGIDTPIVFTADRFGSLKFVIPQPGKVRKVEGMDEIKNLPYVLDFGCELADGYVIGDIKNGRNRPAFFIVAGNSSHEVEAHIA